MSAAEQPFRQVGPIEYEIQIDGRTKPIRVPFALTEKIFHSFISNGGIIDAETGQIQQDILSLISSFREIGNLLLGEYDEEGHTTKEGNCANLAPGDVMHLFMLAAHVVESFIQTLIQSKAPKDQPESGSEKGTGKKKA